MSPTIPLLLATCFLAFFVAKSFGRYVIVGDPKAEDGSSWTILDYTEWEKKNPLYVGDIAVFKYVNYHNVGLFTNKNSYMNCDFGGVVILGDETSGAGKGVYVKVTSKPQYIGCMSYGHCVYGQKVILNGTLGPLPPSPPPPRPPPRRSSPPPPRRSSPPPPRRSSPPPPRRSSPPPPRRSSPPPPRRSSPPPRRRSPPPRPSPK